MVYCTKQQEICQESQRSDVATGNARWPTQRTTHNAAMRCTKDKKQEDRAPERERESSMHYMGGSTFRRRGSKQREKTWTPQAQHNHPARTPPHDTSTRRSKQREETENKKSQSADRDEDRGQENRKKNQAEKDVKDKRREVGGVIQESNYRYKSQPLKRTKNETAQDRRKTKHNQTDTTNKGEAKKQKGKTRKGRTEGKRQGTNKTSTERATAKQQYIHTSPLGNPFLITHHQDRPKHKAQGDLEGGVEKEREHRGELKEQP